jgi:hypothetical protein
MGSKKQPYWLVGKFDDGSTKQFFLFAEGDEDAKERAYKVGEAGKRKTTMKRLGLLSVSLHRGIGATAKTSKPGVKIAWAPVVKRFLSLGVNPKIASGLTKMKAGKL